MSISGQTPQTIKTGRDAVTNANKALFDTIKTKQGTGTVVTSPGNVDVTHQVSEFELQFYHIRLRKIEPAGAGTTKNVDVIAKYTPNDYDRAVEIRSFDQYDQVDILHNPRLTVPTTATLSNDSIQEGNDIGETIGVISSDGPEAVFTLGGTDAASFTISGNLLQAAESYVFATKSSYSITITATNGVGASTAIAHTINITQ